MFGQAAAAPAAPRLLDGPASVKLLLFVSMFAPDPAGGIQAFQLDLRTGDVTPAATTGGCPNSFFLALSPDHEILYALTAGAFGDAATEAVTAWRIVGPAGGLEPLGRRPAGGAATCFLTAVPDGPLLVAHYTGGTVATLPLRSDGGLAGDPVVVARVGEAAGVVEARQEAPHPHAIIAAPWAEGNPRFAFTADLGCDVIGRYRLDAAGQLAGEPTLVKTPPGAGPRHLTFHPDGRRLYVINELANTVGVYDFEAATGRLTERQIASTLPGDVTGPSFTADVKVTPDGRFLYGTNRGHDSLAVFSIAADGRLALVEVVPSRGKGPQHIAITPDGSLLVCANMPGDSLTVFRIDRTTGRLAAVGEPVAVKSPSSIVIVP
jgi:6-phosphogluconolactonase